MRPPPLSRYGVTQHPPAAAGGVPNSAYKLVRNDGERWTWINCFIILAMVSIVCWVIRQAFVTARLNKEDCCGYDEYIAGTWQTWMEILCDESHED